MNKYQELNELIKSLEKDFEKFYEKKNSAAGTRLRKGLQELKNLAQEIRAEVLNVKSMGSDEWDSSAEEANLEGGSQDFD